MPAFPLNHSGLLPAEGGPAGGWGAHQWFPARCSAAGGRGSSGDQEGCEDKGECEFISTMLCLADCKLTYVF